MLTVCVRAWFADVGIHIEHDDGGRAVADAHVVMMPMHKGPFKGRKFQFLYTGFPASINSAVRQKIFEISSAGRVILGIWVVKIGSSFFDQKEPPWP